MPEAGSERLDSWKEIAEHLGRDVRTVRRWEKDRSLPVHRVPGGGRAAVYAFRSEIDAWLKGQDGKLSGDGHGDGVPASVLTEFSPTASLSEGLLSSTRPAVVQRGEVAKRLGLRRRVWWLAIVTFTVAVLVLAAYRLWLHGSEIPIASARFSGTELIAGDDQGKVVWRFDFREPLNLPQDLPEPEMVRVADLGPGRRQDVLSFAPLFWPGRANSPSDALYCISARGKLRWRHNFDERPSFSGREYGPPWVDGPFLVTSDQPKASIWCSARENYSSVSMLVQLDPDNRLLAKFINWGHIWVLNRIHGADGLFILAGGISNQCDCAFLAVLREDDISGSSPALSPEFRCDNCPQGQPYRYLLFPQSELTVPSGAAYSQLSAIREDEGRIWVGVNETRVPGLDNWKRYDLSDSFVPQSVWVSDQYWALHRQLELEGKIHHSVEQCPERTQPQPVRMWSPEAGWKDIKVPVVPVPR